jgi:hypothetical protein
MEDALKNDFLDQESLAQLNAYQPSLSASWLFQKCMSVPPGARQELTLVHVRAQLQRLQDTFMI